MDPARLQETVRDARAGDEAAFAEIYEAYARRVRGLCRKMLGSADAAEDAVSEIFLKVRNGLTTYDESRPFTRWLLSIAGNHCTDMLRRRGLERRLFDHETLERRGLPSGGPGPLAEVLGGEEREAVRRVVEALPERYRVPLVLRFYADLSYDEIAEATGLTRNNVATLLFRAKKRLREALAPALQETRS